MSDAFERARACFTEGLQAVQDNRLDAAEAAFEASLALLPGRPSSLTNLGVVRVRRGRFAEALPALDAALAQEPDNLDALGHRAIAHAELGRREAALRDTTRALALQPGLGAVWGLHGTLLRELGRHAQAVPALERAIALGHEVQLHRHTLAALRGETPPPEPPPGYVAQLFDGYAEGFDTHLQQLGYRAPELLLRPLQEAGLRVPRALDLGCGTGLCGPWLRPLAAHRTGVDLSAAMLARAGERGDYDTLMQGDLLGFLQSGDGDGDWPLVVAADVFIYVGALDPVFAALARRMPAGGLLCFSLEDSGGADLLLRPSLRYAHSRASVHALAQAHGFAVERIDGGVLRHERDGAVAGLFAGLRRRAG